MFYAYSHLNLKFDAILSVNLVILNGIHYTHIIIITLHLLSNLKVTLLTFAEISKTNVSVQISIFNRTLTVDNLLQLLLQAELCGT